MRYSIEPRDRIYVKSYGFLSFAKNMVKNLSNKYSQKLLGSAKNSTATDAIKTALKRAIQKTAVATGDLIGDKIADKITSHSQNNLKEAKNEIEMRKERYTSPKERQHQIKHPNLEQKIGLK